MSIRNRINQFSLYLSRQIMCSKGGILLGRVTDAGETQEIELGDGLEFDGDTLNATPPSESITNAKLAYMAESTIKGRQAGAGTGAPEDLTAAQARAVLELGSAATTESTAYATAAQGTDSREWTAATVEQAEAEAGSATTRRAWTAQRVRQAIAAWWATVSSTKADASHVHAWGDITSGVPLTFAPSAHTQAASTISDSTATGRSLLTAANAGAARTTLELGNAALATTSTGGNGAADSGKVVAYDSLGNITARSLYITNGPYTLELYAFGLTGSISLTCPNVTGVIATTTSLAGVPDNLVTSSTKTTPIDADSVLMTDSAAAGTPAKRVTFANLWTWIKSKIESVALTLVGVTITNYTEAVVAIGTVTSSNTLALTNGTRQRVRLTASTACTFAMPTATDGKSFVLEVEQAATTGLGTAVFTGVDFGAAGAPIITPTAGKMDIVTFMANGTKWYGAYNQGFTY